MNNRIVKSEARNRRSIACLTCFRGSASCQAVPAFLPRLNHHYREWNRTCLPPNSRNLTQRCRRSEEHTSELQSLMRISYAVFCLKKKKIRKINLDNNHDTITINLNQ